MLSDVTTKRTADSVRKDILQYLSGQNTALEFPKAITKPGQGGKFDIYGNVMHHPGNTFVCHVDQKSDFFVSLCALQDGLKRSALASNYTFLPQHSFHVTIFCGISGSPLGVDGWPKGMPLSANLDQITQQFDTKISAWEKFNKVRMQPSGMSMPGTVRMIPATDIDARILREARHQLQDLTGLYRNDIDTYEFHISLGYLKQWYNDDEAAAAIAEADSLFYSHLSAYRDLEFGPIEFCKFQNMHYFEIIRVLGNAKS